VDGDDVSVPQPRDGKRLATEPRFGTLRCLELRPQNLERHLAIERLLPREKHLSHATLAEPAEEDELAEAGEPSRRLAMDRLDDRPRLLVEPGVACEEPFRLLGLARETRVEIGVQRIQARKVSQIASGEGTASGAGRFARLTRPRRLD